MKAYVICVPGTSETHEAPEVLPPLGLTKSVTDLLPDKIGDTYIYKMSIPYTSGYGDKASYLNSVNNGKEFLTKLLIQLKDQDPDALIFLVGYSQGATIAGDITRDWGLGLNAIPEVTAYYGIADPRRNRGDLVGPPVEGCGITGERGHSGKAADRFFQFCAPGDIIASSDPDKDLFMEASEFTNQFWVGDVISWIGFTIGTLADPEFQDRLRKNYSGITGWFKFNSKLARTFDRGFNYIKSNVHTKYATYNLGAQGCGMTVPEWIADDITESINENIEDRAKDAQS